MTSGHERLRRRADRDAEVIDQVLDGLGARLAALRGEHGISLKVLAEYTGLSPSTLSRLETGGRRPTLALLLPIALAYGVPLDTLLGFPGFTERRVRSAPAAHTSDMIAWRLTHANISPEPLKVVYSVTESTPPPELPAHAGWKWMYVLSGRMRLLIEDQDMVLTAGELVEFDTRRPHWTGSTGEEPAEVLVLVGYDGVEPRRRRLGSAKPAPDPAGQAPGH